jgi:AcrR family transcriptional regulator
MKILTKEAWLIEGLHILGTDGFAKITIDNLCGRLHITKGSFYHHFKSTDGYISALMQYWLEKNTLNIISATEHAASASEKKRILYQHTFSVDHKAELSIRAWGHSHPAVKEYVKKVDNARLEFLTDIYQLMGHDQAKAADMAVLEYISLLGIQQLFPEISREDMERLQQLYNSEHSPPSRR